MARLSALCVCVCAVLLCSVFVSDIDAYAKFGSRFGGWGLPKFKPPSRTHPVLKTHVFSNHRKAPKPHTNNAPIGFQHFQTSVRKPQTNAAPIGFEHFYSPPIKSQTPIGFERFSKNPRVSSAPALPVYQHNIPHAPSAPVIPVPHQSIPYTHNVPVLPGIHQNSPYAPSAPALPVHHQNIPHAPSAPVIPVPQQNIPYTHKAPVVPGLHQNSPYTPSAPALPAFHQNIPNAPGAPSVSSGFYQPVGGIFPSNQFSGKVNNPYQSNPNYGWNVYGSSHFKPSSGYPKTGYPNNGHSNIGYPNTGYPNTGYQNTGFTYNPSQPFGQHSNPNFGHQIYPNNYLGNNYYGAPNSFSNPNFGNSYNPYGNNYFPGGGYGYSGYPGQFGYNNYKPKSKFGFGGLPLPIPIPIPIPLGGFGFGGLGGHRSNDNSHHVLNSLQNTTSLNSTTNATSIYVVNNVTVVSCTNELFTYGQVNITVTTCAADNCTSVKVYMANNSSVNQSVITMCLGPVVTVTSNSSSTVKPELTNIFKYWKMICTLSVNTTLNGTTTITKDQNITKPTSPTFEANPNAFWNTTPVSALNSTRIVSDGAVNATLVVGNKNNTDRMCEILNCSYVEMCLPETSVDSNTKKAYRPCVRIKMCKSPNTPISHHVTLNTTVIRYEGVNKTESYSLNNITVLAFYPVTNNCSANSTVNNVSCVLPVRPLMNTTGFAEASNSSTSCTKGDGASFCNSTSNSNTTSTSNVISSDYLELTELKKRFERLQQIQTDVKDVKEMGDVKEISRAFGQAES